jgi:hypothetical protein
VNKRERSIAIVLLGILLISTMALYGRWTLFLPYDWVQRGRACGWWLLFISMAIGFLLRIEGQRKRNQKAIPSKSMVIVMCLISAAALSYWGIEVAMGVVAFGNQATSRANRENVCVQLLHVSAAGDGAWQRTRYADVRLLRSGDTDPVQLRYLESKLPISSVSPGENFEVIGHKGLFGYSFEDADRIKRGCDGR